MRAFFLTSLLFFSTLYAGGVNSGSLFLINDSPFILTATVLSADGSFLGELSVQPGEQKTFTSPTGYNHPGFPQASFTPYTVVWQCPSEGYYSVCTQVSPGSLVKAGTCPGPYFCKPKPKEQSQEKKPASTLKKQK